MNSPWGGGLDSAVSTDGSRRNSLNVNQSLNASYTQQQDGSKMSQHLSRLHKKAQDHQAMAAASSKPGVAPSSHTVPPPSQQHQHPSSRRASDPVRALDRNFGVGQQTSKPQRSGSFTQINDQQSSRMPMHGQPYHGGSNFQQLQPQQPPVRPASVGQPQFGQYGATASASSHHQYSMQGFYNNQELWNNTTGYGNFGQYSGQNEYFNGQWPGQHMWQQGGSSSSQGRQWPADWQQRSNQGQQANSYQRTLEYVQQCQSSWNGQAPAPQPAQPPPPPQPPAPPTEQQPSQF